MLESPVVGRLGDGLHESRERQPLAHIIGGVLMVIGGAVYGPHNRCAYETPGRSTSHFGDAQGELIGAGLYHYGQGYYDPNLMRFTPTRPPQSK